MKVVSIRGSVCFSFLSAREDVLSAMSLLYLNLTLKFAVLILALFSFVLITREDPRSFYALLVSFRNLPDFGRSIQASFLRSKRSHQEIFETERSPFRT